jgi:hypothetical protein
MMEAFFGETELMRLLVRAAEQAGRNFLFVFRFCSAEAFAMKVLAKCERMCGILSNVAFFCAAERTEKLWTTIRTFAEGRWQIFGTGFHREMVRAQASLKPARETLAGFAARMNDTPAGRAGAFHVVVPVGGGLRCDLFWHDSVPLGEAPVRDARFDGRIEPYHVVRHVLVAWSARFHCALFASRGQSVEERQASPRGQAWASQGQMPPPASYTDSDESEMSCMDATSRYSVPRYMAEENDDGRDEMLGPLVAKALLEVKEAHPGWGLGSGAWTPPVADFQHQMGFLRGGMCSTFPSAYVSAYERRLDLFETTFFYGQAKATDVGQAVVARVNKDLDEGAEQFVWTPSPWCRPL